ncbi:hypothetical protein Desca_2457 [Desulfotomaculum nigrificans CO-1-SRB]|uniref:Uncharacterized protein n=1 Tax=Desulfotomaculum nigrificans (strain DSM 14880 / VKM B-2319 / CO-1-SRB) TaxID=868595 RepID=F6B4A8_DESCC|nr:hypothetical protein [Desulfotomaculum nigrificans]AEF95285.1 hypothetical protein Desca_2457 [Desulfotomaculum nigrificans CO-1-SRB]
MQNNSAKYFVFMVLIVYVMIASSIMKAARGYLVTLQLNPWTHLALSLGLLVLLGLGLVAVNKFTQAWVEKKK